MDQPTMFAQDAVRQLHQDDFDLGSETKINIKLRECMLVLFYSNNVESTNLANIWLVAAKNTVGPVFAAVNLMVERKVAEAFTSLNMQNGSLHWAALKTVPFILVYQNSWPIGFYNGERSVQAIIDYALTLACHAEYHEPINIFGGQTVSSQDNLLMKGVTQYGIPANPFRKDSLAFSANENLRGYDKTDTVKQFGSAGEVADSKHTLAAEEASRVGITQTTVPITAVPTGFPTEAPPGSILPGGVRVPERLTPGLGEGGVAAPTEQGEFPNEPPP